MDNEKLRGWGKPPIILKDTDVLHYGEKSYTLKQVHEDAKLRELVEERIKELEPVSTASDEYDEWIILQSFLDRSKRNE